MTAAWISAFRVLLLVGNARLAFSFRAAVFEHAQQSYANFSYTPEDIVRSNLEYYTRAAQFAGSKGVEVLVFPEYGIFPPTSSRERLKRFLEYVPDPQVVSSNPCQHPDAYKMDRPILYTLSCLSRSNGIVIVANMGDVQPCAGKPSCPDDGTYHFNTNVAFGRDGRILAKYHKEHLFEEPGMDVPEAGQDPTFETHLGRFATFVCFDIVFRRMAEVARREDIRAVLFPTMWINSGPLFNAPQYFEAWARGNNATLLAANVHLPGRASLGSVIVQKREGVRAYTFNPDGNSKLLVADLGWSECSPKPKTSTYIVSKDGFKEWTDDGRDVGRACSEKVLKPAEDLYKNYRCRERDMTNVTLKRLVAPSGRLESCSAGLCCSLEYAAEELRGDFYLGVFNGSYSAAQRYFFAEEVCFLARCDGLGNRSCVTFPTRSETLFRRVRIRSNFSTDFIYPSVLESGMRTTPTSQWKFETADKTATISFRDASGKPLLVVGLKARPYARDPPYVK